MKYRILWKLKLIDRLKKFTIGQGITFSLSVVIEKIFESNVFSNGDGTFYMQNELLYSSLHFPHEISLLRGAFENYNGPVSSCIRWSSFLRLANGFQLWLSWDELFIMAVRVCFNYCSFLVFPRFIDKCWLEIEKYILDITGRRI